MFIFVLREAQATSPLHPSPGSMTGGSEESNMSALSSLILNMKTEPMHATRKLKSNYPLLVQGEGRVRSEGFGVKSARALAAINYFFRPFVMNIRELGVDSVNPG